MKKRFLNQLLVFLKFQFIVFFRRIKFSLNSKSISSNSDFLSITTDENFTTSLIKIEFYFSRLLYVKMPQLGKKLYNGELLLNPNKMRFPYQITVYTFGKKRKYLIESFEGINDFHSNKFKITDFKSFKCNYKQSGVLDFPKYKFGYNQPMINMDYNFSPQFLKKKIKFGNFTIEHQPFNSNDFI